MDNYKLGDIFIDEDSDIIKITDIKNDSIIFAILIIKSSRYIINTGDKFTASKRKSKDWLNKLIKI